MQVMPQRRPHAITAGAHLVVMLTTLLVTTIISLAAIQGSTVWDGVYTEEQAVRGEQVYEDECSFCHLDDLMGDAFASPLVDDAFTVRWEGGHIGDLMTVIQVTMPADRPATLTNEAVADVIAFLLKMNDYPTGDAELAADPAELESIVFTSPEP